MYSIDQLKEMGIEMPGNDICIDSSVKIFNPTCIKIQDHVRIDANSVISAAESGLEVGSYVHIAVGVSILGQGQVTIGSFCGISAGVRIFSSSDDYSGGALTNPTVPEKYRSVSSGLICLEEHAIIGANSVILPNVTIGKGAAVGALSMVNKNIPEFAIVTGTPLRKIGIRPKSILKLGKKLQEDGK